MSDDVSPSPDKLPPATPHRRRPRYSGRNPRRFEDKYKEHDPQRYADTAAKVIASGKTPAGTHRPIMVSEILGALAPKAGETVSKNVQTQVGRALAQLGIRHIAAYSPRRAAVPSAPFRTLQGRLPKELALAGITTIAAANRWLAETYWPAHNAAFAVAPAEIGSAFVLDRTGRVREILCLQEERRVGNDNTVKWRGLSLQIPPSPRRAHFVRATVRVHDYPDGHLAIFHGPHRLADYDPQGKPCNDAKLAAEPLRQPACGFVDNAARCPQPHRHNHNRSVN